MGYIQHDAVIVTTQDIRPGGLPDIDGFRASLPEYLRPLVIGPFSAAYNGYVTYVFLPDGSKEGWKPSDEAEEARERFVDLFDHKYSDGSTHDDVVSVTFGGDHRYEFPVPQACYEHEAFEGEAPS